MRNQQRYDRETADWTISGAVYARGDAGKIHVQIATADGREVWTRDRDAAAGRLAAAAAIAATRTAMTIGCALGGPPKHRDPDVLALLFTACDRLDFNADDYDHEAALVALQRLAQNAPNDALAQAYYGTGLAMTAWDMPSPIATAQRAEASRRLDLARRLDPRVGEVWVGRFALVKGEGDYAAKLGMLARGLSIEPSNPILNSIYGALLAEVGRTDEALVFERRAIAFAPAYLAPTQHAAAILSATGRPREALSLLDAGDLRFPGNARQATQRLDVLLTSRDTRAARQLLDHAAQVHDFLEPAGEAATRQLTYAMEQPHGPLADSLAREAVAEVNANPALRPATSRSSTGSSARTQRVSLLSAIRYHPRSSFSSHPGRFSWIGGFRPWRSAPGSGIIGERAATGLISAATHIWSGSAVFPSNRRQFPNNAGFDATRPACPL